MNFTEQKINTPFSRYMFDCCVISLPLCSLSVSLISADFNANVVQLPEEVDTPMTSSSSSGTCGRAD